MANQISGILSPWLRKQRYQAAKPYIQGRVLDFGCGDGKLASSISIENYQGVDIDENALAAARTSYPEYRFSASLSNCEHPPGGYDTIVMLAVLEHLDDPAKFLREIQTQLNRHGRIVLTTPAPGFAWVLKIGAKFRIFSPEAEAEHKPLLGQMGLQRSGRQAGMKIVKYQRFLCGANQLLIFEKDGA